jgi:hypothetical protein
VLASKVLAGAKEGVYQVFMAQMAPGNLLTALPAAAGRLWQSWRELALPQLLSWADFRKQPHRRVVQRSSARRAGERMDSSCSRAHRR